MGWSRRFRIKEYLRNSLWPLPVASIAISSLFLWLIVIADRRIGLPATLSFTPQIANTVATAMVAAMISFLGFALTMVVLVIQFTGGSSSPRALFFIYRDWHLKISLAFFVGTIVFGFLLLGRIDESVPDLAVLAAGTLVVLSLVIFLQFLSHLFHGLTPARVSMEIAKQGHATIARTYPDPASPNERAPIPIKQLLPPGHPPNVVLRNDDIGNILQAIDEPGLVSLATKSDCVILFRRSIGDFVSSGEAVLEIVPSSSNIVPSDREIRSHLVFSTGRSVEQDPAFALRVLVDIATRALSAATNDQMTASQAIDRIEDLLLDLARRDLDTGIQRDAQGTVRLIVPMRTWDDYLRLGMTEIRQCAGRSTQVTRRISSMLKTLSESVPPYRRPAVQREGDRFHRAILQAFGDSDDLALAEVPDKQSFGPYLRDTGDG
jgi:uncharacterized membrane protein